MRRSLLAVLLCLPVSGAAQPVVAERQMVVSGHMLASEAGLAMLRAGGTAVDAAVAVQAVLTLVEPQSSGIGGGAFLLHWDAAARALVAWDGRETAPAAVRPDHFLRNGEPMPFAEAVVGGRAVGVPGVLRMLEAAHAAHGRLPWEALFQPAIRLAEEGFAVSPRLARAIAAAPALRRDPSARALFFDAAGAPLAEGAVLRNPALAETLRAIAERGADALHRGPIAAEIVRTVRGHASPGLMTTDDLAAYAPRRTEAVCLPYRAVTVCGPPPPSGAAVVLQVLGLLGHVEMRGLDAAGADAAMMLGEAGRLAFADRNAYMADPAHAAVPLAGLLDPAYLTLRAQSLSVERAQSAPRAGNPRRFGPAPPSQPPQPEAGTSHISIRDAEGRALSMTTTVEGPFGAHVVVRGFVLNNQLTDFSFAPALGGRPVANRAEGGKRPRSSMSPVIAFRDGEAEIIAGSPGGARIIGYVAQALVAMIDWDLDPQAAASLPHVGALHDVVELEEATAAAGLAGELIGRGLPVELRIMPSGLNLIRMQRGPNGGRLLGGADPRREGAVAGD
jgi:gamma-glutamyltranspeptidase/glutathione hydrolase